VHLVEDDETAGRLGELAMQGGTRRDLGVGDGDAVEMVAVAPVAVLETGREPDVNAVCRIGPLLLEVLGVVPPVPTGRRGRRDRARR
jgi:hypothetical protein